MGSSRSAARHGAAALLVLLLGLGTARGAGPAVTLYCARGNPDYADAQMILSERGRHVVDVTFVGFWPSPARAEWSARDCLSTASRLDGSRDIVARLWHRERRAPGGREPLRMAGAAAALVYRAASRSIVPERPTAAP